MRPLSLPELSEQVRSADQIYLAGTDTKRAFRRDIRPAEVLDMSGYRGIIELHPADQVVVVRAGTTVPELQWELHEHGLCLPIPDATTYKPLLAGIPGTVGGLIAMNLPHALWGHCRGVRDWLLGCTIVRADGTVAKSGSKAVKSVAGFDAHKLMVGARGTLGVVADVIMRLYPLRALPKPEVELGAAFERLTDRSPIIVQRTRRTDFETCRNGFGERLIAADEPSSTIWALDNDTAPKRFEQDWFVRSGDRGVSNHWNPFMTNAKRTLDPQNKLNPGAFAETGRA